MSLPPNYPSKHGKDHTYRKFTRPISTNLELANDIFEMFCGQSETDSHSQGEVRATGIIDGPRHVIDSQVPLGVN